MAWYLTPGVDYIYGGHINQDPRWNLKPIYTPIVLHTILGPDYY